jgi:hypothetical protein
MSCEAVSVRKRLGELSMLHCDSYSCAPVQLFDLALIRLKILNDEHAEYFNSWEELSTHVCLSLSGYE